MEEINNDDEEFKRNVSFSITIFNLKSSKLNIKNSVTLWKRQIFSVLRFLLKISKSAANYKIQKYLFQFKNLVLKNFLGFQCITNV